MPAVFIAILFLSSCSENKIINENKFVKIYSEIVIASDSADIKTDSDSLMKSVLARNNISLAEYQNTVDHYSRDPQKWEQFFNRVISYVDSLQKKQM